MPEITYREAVSTALREALNEDPLTFLAGEDIGPYGGAYAVTKGFTEEFGSERVRDAPLSESVIVGAGVGAAMGGMKPIMEIMTINFTLLAMDQIVNHAAKMRYMSGGQLSVPLIVRTVTGGGAQVAATHSQCFEGMVCLGAGHEGGRPLHSPRHSRTVQVMPRRSGPGAVRGAHPVVQHKGPCAQRTLQDSPGQGGREDVRQRRDHRLLLTHGAHGSGSGREAGQEGIEAEVVDLRCLRPLDMETVVESVKKTHNAVVVEETWKTGGFAAEVAASIQEQAFDYLDAPIGRVAGAEAPMPYSRPLEQAAIPNADKVAAAVKSTDGSLAPCTVRQRNSKTARPRRLVWPPSSPCRPWATT